MSHSSRPDALPANFVAGTNDSAPARSTSAAAVISLVLGVLGGIPFVPGFFAICFAFLGLQATRDTQTGGRRMAIAGLILGLVSFCGWLLAAGIIRAHYIEAQPARDIVREFVGDLNVSNLAAASLAAPSIEQADLTKAIETMKPLGSLVKLTFTSFHVSFRKSPTTISLGGVASFTGGNKGFTAILIGTGTSFSITSFNFQ